METPDKRIAELENALALAETELQAERKARLEFVSLVTHELRVPMTSIKGYTDLLLKGIMGPTNEAQTSFLQTIRANTERMSRMVADLSDINKVNGEALQLSFELVDLSAILQEALASLQGNLEAKEQVVAVGLAAGLPPVQGDRTRLTFIFQRLLENAVQYTPRGGSITIGAVTSGEADSVQVTIEDTGIGIPTDEQGRIGELFFRASDEQTRESTGNGLSLHLCRKLLALHRGSLDFTSTRGMGSTFCVRLPLSRV